MRQTSAFLVIASIAVLRLAGATPGGSFSGAFSADDNERAFYFTLAAPGTVTLQTVSYAAGGFDPTLSVFDATGKLVAVNQDGGCSNVAADPVNGFCWDSFLQLSLPAGNYTAVLTESENLPNGPTLADSFVYNGQGNFTSFTPLGANFLDFTLRQRTPAYALTVTGATSTETTTITSSGTLPNGVTGQAYSYAFSASSGPNVNLVWSVAGSVPPGLTINSSTGVLSGAPVTPGNYAFTVEVTDGLQTLTQPVVITFFAPITITNTVLPAGVANKGYTAAVGFAGGSGTGNWSATGLPAGLTISSGGQISGTPTVGGTFPIVVLVTDPVSGLSQTANLTLVINFAPLQITGSGALGGFKPGSNVALAPGVTGGEPPYVWSVLPPGLPAGFNFSASTGAFSGVAPGSGTYSFSLKVSDWQSPPATAVLSVSFSVLGITTSGLPAAVAGTAYSQTFSATGGTGPYTFSTTAAPAGLTLSSAGLLSGIPKAGTYDFTVTVSDSTGLQVSSNFSLVVNGGSTSPLSVPGGALSDGTVLTSYTTVLSATGGVPPYSWKLVGGALPDGGLSLSSSGGIMGTPSTPNTYTFTAQVTDSAGTNASGTFTIKIDPLPLTLTSIASFPGGIVGSEYPLQTLTANGGVAPYTFALAGTLPGGLSFSSPQISGTPTAAGVFTFTVTLTDSAGNQVIANGSITITPAHADLIISQGTVTFSLVIGAGGLPTPASVAVRSSVVQQLLNFSLTETPAVSWLDLSGAGSTPGSVSLALDSSALSLAAGAPYQTTVEVTCIAPSPCAGNTQKIIVFLTVNDYSPQLTPVDSLLSFYAATSNPLLSSQSLGIQNTGGGSLTINSVTPADSWLTVTGAPSTLTSGPAANLTVTANPSGLSAGYYRSSITINSSAGVAVVPVTLDLTQNPVMSLAPGGQQFHAPAGNPPGQTTASFNVSVLGASSASWTAVVLPGASWLSVSTPSGIATPAVPGTVNFAIDPTISASLTAQTYYGIISVTSSDVVDSPLFYEVVLNVIPATVPPKPGLSTGGLTFTSGATAATSQAIEIFASSTTPILYQASARTVDGASWLSVNPATGTASSSAPGQSSISTTATGLAPGVYHGGVSYAFASDAVRTVNVTLLVFSTATTTGSTSALSAGGNGIKAAVSASNTCAPTKLVPTQVGLVNNFSEEAGWPTPLAINVMDDCGSPVTTAQVVSTFSNGDPPLVLRASDTSSATFVGTWTPRAISTQVAITAQASAPNFPAATPLVITGEVTSNEPPILTPHGTVHVFNPQVGAALAPGTVVAIYGSNLSGGVAPSTTVPLTTSLGGTTVLIGGIPAPLYYVSPGQINAQIPFGLNPGNNYEVLVNATGGLSTPDSLQLTAVDPGIAAYQTGQIIAQHAADYSLVTEASPAVPGEYLIFYLAGLGATDNPVATGGPSPSNPLSHPLIAPVLTLNGNTVPFAFAGLTPTAVGLYQIDFQVPIGTPGGDLTLVVSQAGSPTNSTILPVAK
jgi:uncharacterized protein (TIGR03437 family)